MAANTISAKTYAKNVMNSAGYIATETMNGVDPDLFRFVKENKDLVKDAYHNIRNIRSILKSKISDFLESDTGKLLKETGSNALSDLKTGKFYNPEREAEAGNKAAEAMGLSFDFDFDSNDMNFDVDEKDVESDSSDDSSESNNFSTLADRFSFSQHRSSLLSADVINRKATKNTAISLAHSEKMFGLMNSSLAAINSSIAKFHNDLAQPLNTYMQNLTTFSQTATEQLAKQTSFLENINNLLTERLAPNGGADVPEASPWEKIMQSGALPNVSEWINAIKQNAKNQTNLGMFSGLISPEMLQAGLSAQLSSPIGFLISAALSKKIQNSQIGKVLNTTKRDINRGFMNLAFKFHEHSNDGGLLGTLAKILDIVPNSRGELNFANYNKDRVDWNGKDSKALQDVIPTQLSNIISILSGQPAKIFDYESGTWKTAKDIKKEFSEQRIQNIVNTDSDLKDSIIGTIIDDENAKNDDLRQRGYKGVPPALTVNSRSVITLSKDYDMMVSLLATKGESIVNYTKAQDLIQAFRKYGWTTSKPPLISEFNLRTLARTIFRRRTYQSRFKGVIYSGRLADKNFVDRSSSGAFANIANNSGLMDAHLNNNLVPYNRKGRQKETKNPEEFDWMDVEQRDAKLDKLATSKLPWDRWRYKKLSRQRQDEDGNFYNVDTDESEYEASASSRASREMEEENSPLTKLAERINNKLSDIMYGEPTASLRQSYQEAGLFGVIQTIPETIKNVFESLKESLASVWTSFKESNFGKDFFSEMKESVKSWGRSTLDYGKEQAGKVYSVFTGRVPDWAAKIESAGSEENNLMAAKGGIVRKSGMASVSEGEMIIPAHLNPNYKGRMSDKKRKEVEEDNLQKWLTDGAPGNEYFGSFKDGTKEVKAPEEQNEWLAKAKKSIQKAEEYKSKKIAEYSPIINEKINQVKNTKDSIVRDPKAFLANVEDRITTSIGQLFGDVDQFGDAKQTTKKVLDVAKDALPQTLAKGTMGALIGAAATGSSLGLLGGFVIGAGSNILKNSEELSEKFFGKKDELTGEYNGGFLSPKVSKFIKEKLPTAAKAGSLGSVLGTVGVIPGGIFGGFVIGAGLNLVSSTDTFKDVLLGKPDINGNRKGGITGSLKVHVIDPLREFTKDGLSKVASFFRDEVFKPISGIVRSSADWFKGIAKRVTNVISDYSRDIVKRTFGEKFDKIFGKLSDVTGSIAKTGLNTVKTLVSKPLQAVDKAFKIHNIKAGYSSMTPEQRIEYMKSVGKGKKISRYTNWASAEGRTLDDIQQAVTFFNGRKSVARERTKLRQELRDVITASLVNGGVGEHETVSQITDLLNKNKIRNNDNYDSVIKKVQDLAASGKLDPADSEKLITRINETREKILAIRDREANFDRRQKEFFKANNLKGLSKKAMRRARIQSSIDLETFEKNKQAQDRKEFEEMKRRSDAKKLLQQQEQTNPIDSKRNALLSNIQDLLNSIAVKMHIKTDKLKLDSKIVTDNDFDKEAEDGDIKTEFIDGTPVQYIYKNGQWNKNLADSSTKQAEIEHQTKQSFFKLFATGHFFTAFKSLFGSNDKKEKPEKEKKKSPLLDKFKKLFGFGEDEEGKKSGFISRSIKKLALAAVAGAASIWGLGQYGKYSAGSEYDSGMTAGKDLEARKAELDNAGFFSRAWTGVKNLYNKAIDNKVGTHNEGDYLSSEHDLGNVLGRAGFNYITSPVGLVSSKPVVELDRLLTLGKRDYIFDLLTRPRQKWYDYSRLWNGHWKDWFEHHSMAKPSDGIFARYIKRPAIKTVGKITNAFADHTKLGRYMNKSLRDYNAKILRDRRNPGFFKKIGKKIGKYALSFLKESKDIGIRGVKTVSPKTAEALVKFQDFVSKFAIKILEKFGFKATSPVLAQQLAERVGKVVAQKATTKLATGVAKLHPVILGVFVLVAVGDALQDAKAKTILRILEPPTIWQRIVAALLAGLNQLIPIIGGIIPTQRFLDICLWFVEQLGFDTSGFREQRKRAEEKLAEWNANPENPKYNLEEYIHNYLGESTSLDRFWEDLKDDPLLALSPLGQMKASIDNIGYTFGLSDNETYNKIKDSVYKIHDTGKALSPWSIMKNAIKANNFLQQKAKEGKGLTKADINQWQDIMFKSEFTKSISNSIIDKFQSFADKSPNIIELVSDLWKLSDPFASESYKSIIKKYSDSSDSIFGSFNNVAVNAVSAVMRLINTVVAPFRYIPGLISQTMENLKPTAEKVSNKAKNIDSAYKNMHWYNPLSVMRFYKSIFAGNSELTSGKGSDIEDKTIHTTQKGNYEKFGSSTIDKSGCGPAVADTVLKSYGKNIGINNAAKYAEEKNYVNKSGTDARYFNDILSKANIPTNYTNNRSEIESNINSGRSTILLGQDDKNTSKSKSPFGPNPHYVVARGTDKRGNIIVDDPELSHTTVYDKSILKKTNLGIATGKSGGGVSDLLSKTFDTIFDTVSSKLGPDSSAGKFFNLIFGKKEEKSNEQTSDSESESGSENGVSISGISSKIFDQVSDVKDLDKYPAYKALYSPSSDGGVSNAIVGVPRHSRYHSLSNCIGYVIGRFNHIYNMLTGTNPNTLKFDFRGNAVDCYNCGQGKYNFPWDGKPGQRYNNIQRLGLETSTSIPMPGAVMVWAGGGKGAGHVAMVERVISDTEVITSESGYGYGAYPVYSKQRIKGNGNWGQDPGYQFLGFVYNPGVKLWLKKNKTKVSDSNSDDDVINETTKTIWVYLINNILSKPKLIGDYKKHKKQCEIWAAAIMGNWKQESQLSITIENKDSKAYGLAQWLGTRKDALILFRNEMLKKSKNLSDLQIQLKFVQQELFFTEHDTRIYIHNHPNDSIETATHQFRVLYERCAEFEANDANRIHWAKKYYAAFSKLSSIENTKSQKITGPDKTPDSPNIRENNKQSTTTTKTQQPTTTTKTTGQGSGLNNVFKINSDITRATGIPKSWYTGGESEFIENLNLGSKFNQNKIDKQIASSPDLNKYNKSNTLQYKSIDFTNPKMYSNKSYAMAQTKSSSSAIRSALNKNKSSMSTNTFGNIGQIIGYLDVIAKNTTYNSIIPEIVSIIKEFINTLSTMNNTNKNLSKRSAGSDIAAKMADQQRDIENSISLMKSRLEAIARAI